MAKKKAAAEKGDLEWIAEDLRGLAVPIGGLKLDPRNARKHGEENLRAIEASLKKFGQVKPIVVHRQTKIVEAGNGLLTVARRLNWSHVAVVWVEHDETAQRGFSIADNRTAELAEWDDELLGDLIAELQDDSPDLLEDLLLADLLAEDKGSAATGDGDPKGTFQVVADCKDEADQKALFDRLQKEGRKCQLRVSISGWEKAKGSK